MICNDNIGLALFHVLSPGNFYRDWGECSVKSCPETSADIMCEFFADKGKWDGKRSKNYSINKNDGNQYQPLIRLVQDLQ